MSQEPSQTPMRIGLTGGIASGKSTVARFFAEFGIETISADHIAKIILAKNSPILKKVEEKLGSHLINPNGELNRIALRKEIFENDEKRHLLNSITHPAIGKKLLEAADSSTSKYVILEIPLLIEANMKSYVDRILVVNIDLSDQLQRITQRDNCSIANAKKITEAQLSMQERATHAHDLIYNNANIQHLYNSVKLLHQKYLNIIHQSPPNAMSKNTDTPSTYGIELC